MMQYIPRETHIKTTCHVINVFDKPSALEGPSDDNAEVKQAEIVPESELTTV
jgi:hypothetical protein